MRPHTTIYTSSYVYICVLIRLYMRPHMAIYASSYVCRHASLAGVVRWELRALRDDIFPHYLVKLQDAHESSWVDDCQTNGILHDYNWDPQNNIRNNGGSARSKDTSQKNNGNLVQTRWFACLNRILTVIEIPRRIFIVKNLSAAFTCKFTGPAKMPANLVKNCSHRPTQEPCTHIHNQNHI